ncbi:MAG TPA: hypothetical protein VEK57_23215 [Thermoanaerobaculia bacterium]|nr:hypothetical protein [Thermoanaerobaculia bacterium]
MSLAFLIAIVLGAITEAASVQPVFASVAVARESRGARRGMAVPTVRVIADRDRPLPRPRFRTLSLRRFLAPLTGAAAPRAPARVR